MKLICLTLAACIALAAGAAAPAPGPTSAQALVRSLDMSARLQERKACHSFQESRPFTNLTEQLARSDPFVSLSLCWSLC